MKLQPVLCHLVYDVALSDVFLRYPPEGACWVGTEKTTLKKWRRKYVSFFFKRFFFSLCKKLLHKLMFSLISIIKSLCLTSFLTEILQERVEWYILISSQFSNINCQNNFQLNFNTRTITSKERNSTPKISVKESKRNTEPPSIYQYLSLYGFLLLV